MAASGGHVEPGEHPVDTVRREAREELGIAAEFDRRLGERPLAVTVAETVGSAAERHTDVSLWFVLAGSRDQTLTPDLTEFRRIRGGPQRSWLPPIPACSNHICGA